VGGTPRTFRDVLCERHRAEPGHVVAARYRDDVDIARTLTAAVAKDDGWYVARCLEVEVASQGETVDEALANLREALELFFEDDEVPAAFDHPLVTPIEIRIPA
jgi:predicted RNase H-like HicB family nuclease